MRFRTAMGELCTLMLLRQLNSDSFARWVRRYYGEPKDQSSAGLVRLVAKHHEQPHPLDTLRVLEFDRYLQGQEIRDSGFKRAMLELRNVFARNANIAPAESQST